MLNLIKADLYKLFRSKSFYICGIISVAMILISAVTLELVSSFDFGAFAGEIEGMEQISGFFNDVTAFTFPTFAIVSNGFYIVFGIAFALFATADFSTGTIKCTVSKGFERWKVFASKAVVTGICGAILIGSTIISAFVFGAIFFGFEGTTAAIVLGFLGFLGLQILLIFAFSFFVTMVSFLFRGVGATIAVSVCAIGFWQVICSGLNWLLAVLLNIDTKIENYTSVFANSVQVATINPASNDVIRSILVAIGFIAISSFISIITFNKRDIK
ncbi:MAG: hypothetical protein RR540_03670 [Oscillospiraceae bacterium]